MSVDIKSAGGNPTASQIEEIASAFGLEMQIVPEAATGLEAPSGSSGDTSNIAALDRNSSQRIAFENGGFAIGSFVTKKKAADASGFWQITAFALEDIVELEKHSLITDVDAVKRLVPLLDLLSQWRLVDAARLPRKYDMAVVTSGCPS